MKNLKSILLALSVLFIFGEIHAGKELSKYNVLEIIDKVNNYWIDSNPNPGNAFWHPAAYQTGNMEAFYLTGNKKYRDYAEKWAEQNQWMGAQSNDTTKWKYSYGESSEYVLFGDWQICFQTYIDLFHIDPDRRKITRAIEVMEYQMATPQDDYWWWVDGLYMVMPVMTKLYKITGKEIYLDKLYEYFSFAKELMYDEDSKLFYRDAKYIYPKHKTNNGEKDFWARGVGWLFAGLTKVLDDLPFYDTHRDEYIKMYLDLAEAIVESQQPEGYWSRSMLDPKQAPGYETSGTAFFTKGLLWGLNNNYLKEEKYKTAAISAWEYLVNIALQDNGRVGYVQPIGERADQHVVNSETTADFGVGAFLLAAVEMYKYIENQQEWKLIWSDEFNENGKPNTAFWNYENGFVRNEEIQWYQEDNATIKNGLLTIEGRVEEVKNTNYDKDSRDWRRNRPFAQYTSSSINTQGKFEFQYGRVEVRAKIPTPTGSWPAIWLLGKSMEWPSNGEIDMMEYYLVNDKPAILANAAWGTDQRWTARWNDAKIPFSHFTKDNPNWEDEFHIWRMDWDETTIKLYLDDVLLNTIRLEETYNGKLGRGRNPFRQPHYLLLNLALGGNGGNPNPDDFPLNYDIDYVRVYQKQSNSIQSGQLWFDNNGKHINAHGGGMLYDNGKYYWFGEHKAENTNSAMVGVTCYSSEDLVNWTYEGVALPVSDDESSDIVQGSVIERPKVIYNPKTNKYVMWFHLELKGQGYAAARAAFAVSDNVAGPYKYVGSKRINPGKYPFDMPKKIRKNKIKSENYQEWWTPEWYEAVDKGLFIQRDLKGGQMSRDMTLYVDDDGKAYHIYSSEENLTLHIAELTDDFLDHTGKYTRLAPAGHNEAPAIFKKDGVYWMITSGCTGWDPNEARLFSSSSIWGPWKQYPNPAKGKKAKTTFDSQSTYIQPIHGKENAFLFMGDRWRPRNPIDGRYVWLPIQFDDKGVPFLEWLDEWDITFFDK